MPTINLINIKELHMFRLTCKKCGRITLVNMEKMESIRGCDDCRGRRGLGFQLSPLMEALKHLTEGLVATQLAANEPDADFNVEIELPVDSIVLETRIS